MQYINPRQRTCSGLLSLLIVFVACAPPPPNAVQPISVFETIQPLHPQAAHHLVFALNPNDCLNCLHLFNSYIKRLANDSTAGITIVMHKVRPVEQQDILKNTLATIDTNRITVCWDNELYEEIQAEQGRERLNTSVLEVFDTQGKLIFRNEVRKVNGTEPELQALLH